MREVIATAKASSNEIHIAQAAEDLGLRRIHCITAEASHATSHHVPSAANMRMVADCGFGCSWKFGGGPAT